MASIDPTFFLTFFLIVGGMILFLAILVAWAFWKPLLAIVPASPDAVRRDLAFRLRATGYTVDAAKAVLRIKIDSLSALKLHVRPRPQGTEIRYEVDATGLGWAIVLIFAAVGYLGVVAIAIGIAIHLTARQFARSRVAPLLAYPPLGTLPAPDVRSLLVEGLSEAQRLASEALEYEREARQTAIGLIVIGAIALWVVVFVTLGIYVPLPVPNPGLFAVLLAFAVSVAAGSAGSWVVYAKTSPRVKELEQDASFYRMVWTGEALGAPTPGGPRGGLELLLRAAERSYYWREIRRRRRLWHDPVAGLTMFVLAYGATFLPFLAIAITVLSWEWRAFLVALGALFAAGGIRFVRSWTREVREQDEADRIDWEKRRAAIEAELWKILSG